MKIIRTATASDIGRIVEIHINAFQGFFMTKLGSGFLREYYKVVLNYEKPIFLVTEKENHVTGFVAGFLQPVDFYAQLRKHKFALSLSLIPTILRDPHLVPRILRNFRSTTQAKIEEDLTVCELASVAVDPTYSGQGLGNALIQAFLKKSRQLGADTVYLTTDAYNNEVVNLLYQRLGFELYRSFRTQENRVMNEYRIMNRSKIENII